MSRFPKRVVLVAGLGLCLIPATAAICWRPIALRYHLYHLSHGACAYRDAALRYLLHRNGLDVDESTRVDEVMSLAQEDGRKFLAVFQTDSDGDSEVGERRVWLFDQETAFVLTGELRLNGFKDLTGDGNAEFVIECLWFNDDDRDFQVLCVLTVNRVMRPLLIVCCEDGGGDFSWSFRSRPGPYDFEIGQGQGEENFTLRATYRWSPEAGTYVGPKGGEAEPYVRFESWEDLRTFVSSSGPFKPPGSAR